MAFYCSQCKKINRVKCAECKDYKGNINSQYFNYFRNFDTQLNIINGHAIGLNYQSILLAAKELGFNVNSTFLLMLRIFENELIKMLNKKNANK